MERIPPIKETALPMSSGIIPTKEANPLAIVANAVTPAVFAPIAASAKRLNGAASDDDD